MRTSWWLLVALAACGRVGFTARQDASDAASDTSGDTMTDTGVDTAPLGTWMTSQPITALNTASDDSDPEIRGDGLEIIFHSNRAGGAGGYDLYHSVRSSSADAFPSPTPLGGVNTVTDELGPSLSADGLTLYFASGQDIVFATRVDVSAAFGGPQALPALSSADVDTTPELSGDGRVAMTTRGVTGARDLWIYTRMSAGPPTAGWSAGTLVAELASTVTDCSPDLDPQGLTVHFHSDRLGTVDDIFVATRASTSTPFGAPSLVDVISTAMDEGDPSLTADQRTIVFHRRLDLQISTR